MNRREFVRLAGGGRRSARWRKRWSRRRSPGAGEAAARPRRPDEARHPAGGCRGDAARVRGVRREQHLRQPAVRQMDEAWSVDALSKRRDRVKAHGISLDMLPLPMSSQEISRAEMPAIFLGPSPERDR